MEIVLASGTQVIVGMDVDEPALARVIKPEWQGMWKARPFHEFKWSGELAMTTTSSASIYRTIGG
jgi:hypothetical protein